MATTGPPAGVKAEINWYDPHTDFNTIRQWGWCIDHAVTERVENYDPTQPIPPSTVWWMSTPNVIQDWVYMPALRGAIFSPKHYFQDINANFLPCNSKWKLRAFGWYMASDTGQVTSAALNWYGRMTAVLQHQVYGIKTVTHSHDEAAEVEQELRLITRRPLRANESFAFTHQLAAIEPRQGELPLTRGIEVYLGMTPLTPDVYEYSQTHDKIGDNFIPQYSLWMPLGDNPQDPGSKVWVLWKYSIVDGVLIQQEVARHAPFYGQARDGQQAEPFPEGLVFLSTPIGLLIQPWSQPNEGWLIRTDQLDGIPAGHMGIRVFGARGSLAFATVRFPEKVQFIGPAMPMTSEWATEGYARMSMRCRWDTALVDDPENPGEKRAIFNPTASVQNLSWSGTAFVVDPASTGFSTQSVAYPETDYEAPQGQVAIQVLNQSLNTADEGDPPAYLQTPLITSVCEVHPTVYNNGVELSSSQTPVGEVPIEQGGSPPPPFTLQGFVQSLDVQYSESGRGHSATLTLDDVQLNTDGDTGGYDLHQVERRLKGLGRVTVSLAHVWAGEDAPNITVTAKGEDTWVPPTPRSVATVTAPGGEAWDALSQNSKASNSFHQVFVGYAKAVSIDRSGMWPHLTITFGDITSLWGEGLTSMEVLPQPEGWWACEWLRTVLQQNHFASLSDIIFPADLNTPDYQVIDAGASQTITSNDIPIPRLPDGSPLRIDKSSGLTEAIDKVCDILNWQWKIRPDGKIEFWRRVAKTTLQPKFALNEQTWNAMDVILNPTTDDFNSAAATTYQVIIGRGMDGGEIRAMTIDPMAASDAARDTYPFWTGRRLVRFSRDESNANLLMVGSRLAQESRKDHRTFKWMGPGRPLYPGDVVVANFQGDHIGVDRGVKFVVLSKDTRASVGPDGENMWLDTWTCRLVDPDEDPEAYRYGQ